MASTSFQGRRQYNQDATITERLETADGSLHLLAVLDGMGGMAAGDRASQLASEVFLKTMREKLTGRKADEFAVRESLADAAEQAHRQVFTEGQSEPAKRGMGTTLVAIVEKSGRFIVINIGDSRAYLWNPAANQIQRLTRDHSLREEAVRLGQLTDEEAQNSPYAHALTRAVGSGQPPEADLFPEPAGWFTLPEDGALMLCSDGLTGGLTDEQIRQYLAGCRSAQELTDYLVRAAYYGGSTDNISTVTMVGARYQPTEILPYTPPPLSDGEQPTISTKETPVKKNQWPGIGEDTFWIKAALIAALAAFFIWVLMRFGTPAPEPAAVEPTPATERLPSVEQNTPSANPSGSLVPMAPLLPVEVEKTPATQNETPDAVAPSESPAPDNPKSIN